MGRDGSVGQCLALKPEDLSSDPQNLNVVAALQSPHSSSEMGAGDKGYRGFLVCSAMNKRCCQKQDRSRSPDLRLSHIHTHAHREFEKYKRCIIIMTIIQKETWILWSCGIRIHWEKLNLLKESKPTWTSSSSNYFKHGMVKSEKLPWKRELSIRCCKWEPRPPWSTTVECLHELPLWSVSMSCHPGLGCSLCELCDPCIFIQEPLLALGLQSSHKLVVPSTRQ